MYVTWQPRSSRPPKAPSLISGNDLHYLWFTHLHILCIIVFDMNTANYRRALFEADQELARCLVQRQKIDHKVARLQAVITQLQELCAEMDQKNFQRRVERVVKADLKMG